MGMKKFHVFETQREETIPPDWNDISCKHQWNRSHLTGRAHLGGPVHHMLTGSK